MLFTGHQVIFSEDEVDMEYLVKKLKEEYELWGHTVNIGHECTGGWVADLQTADRDTRRCRAYRYPRSIIHKDGKCIGVIETKTARVNKLPERRIA